MFFFSWAETKEVVFTGGSFREGVRVPNRVPGEGVGVGFRWVMGVGVPSCGN